MTDKKKSNWGDQWDDQIEDEDTAHPSYGMIGLSRVHSNGHNPLFGSRVTDHPTTIFLRIHQGERRHRLGRDWFHATDELIEVQMSAAQFTELITTMNAGEGAPCTIRRLQGKMVPEPPSQKPEAKLIADAGTKQFKELLRLLSEAKERIAKLLSKPTLTKADREQIKFLFEKFDTEIKSNMPFMEQQFRESIERTVAAAKAEIDAFTLHTVLQTGLQALRASLPDTPALPGATEPSE